MSSSTVYEDTTDGNEYAEPYADGTADSVGFVSIGGGQVTQYTAEDEISVNYELPGAIGAGDVKFYQRPEQREN